MSALRAAALGGWLLLGVALAAPAVRADEDARQWLAGMNAALAERNYQGEFVHLANGRAEKLRILHRVKDGRISERLVSLTGNGREVVRNDAEVQCYLPDRHQVLVESRDEHGLLLGALPDFGHDLEANYAVAIVGRGRAMAGGEARIIAITPHDGYRFGYRLWIDEETRMPVRTDLCDAHGNVLEQVLFTSLKVGAQLPDSAFRPEVDATGFSWVRQGPSPQHAVADNLPWRLLQLPPGFRISSSGEHRLPGGDAPVTHLVLSDGLASVSVFIEGPPAPPRRPVDGQGQVGSASAYTRIVNGHQVTAVGEVPPQTVEFIAAGVTPAPARDARAPIVNALAPR